MRLPQKGPIAWMAHNHVTANLLMFMVIVAGVVGLSSVKQEIFPAFDLDMVLVSVPYPGASPSEVEQGIVLAVEEAVRGIDGVKRVKGTANESVGIVQVELLISADPQKVLGDVKNEVDRITTLPDDAEEPQVTLAATRSRVVSLVLHGDVDLQTLDGLAESARASLLASPEITQVELEGIPDLEVSVEVPRERLEAYGLSLDAVARAIGASSLELPGGSVKTQGGEVLVRVSDRKRSGDALADVIVLTDPSGTLVRLSDIATIKDGFAEVDQARFFNGERAVSVTAYRVGNETPQAVAAAVRAQVDELRATLPGTIGAEIWDDDSVLLEGRINLLLTNARFGLVLVVGVLALFLNLRLAFWVALGIPISFLGALGFLPGMDISVNMISLFALIVTLGMVVDDAIVVGENIFEKVQGGMDQLEAAIEGAREMAVPVTFAVLTTIAAFAPMLFVPGVFGKIFRIMPIVVFLVLGWSLVESFFVLPAHLAHGPVTWTGGVFTPFNRVQERFAVFFDYFTNVLYRRQLEWALRSRYVVMAGAAALFMITIGLVGGGVVPFSFFPKIEGDVVTASARLPYGVPVERTEAVLAQLQESAQQAIVELHAEDAVTGRLSTLGEINSGGGPGGVTQELGSHLLSYQVQFVPSGEREFSSADFQERWTQLTPEMAGLEVLAFSSDIGPAAQNAAVDVQLSAADGELLAQASADLSEELRTYSDLTQVENGYASGKDQLDFSLRPEARALGLTTVDVARQLRAAFYGTEALREQRDRNEIKVMVRLPKEQRLSEDDVEQLQVRTPAGAYVPLAYVAEFNRTRAPTSIQREAGRRIVDVTADLRPTVPSAAPVLSRLEETTLVTLRERYPGLSTELVGQQREQNESLGSLGKGYFMALFAIYALLAIPFKSYAQPAVVMSAIPFGIVGAVLGHLIMGYELSLISIFGIIALSGVVVNDSLVLIDAVNTRRRKGASVHDAVVWAGTRRLRPIFLTSLTTFFGLAPMIMETEVQARFLIPMAISLGFGVLFSTGVTLLLVPALYVSLEDWLGLLGRLRARLGGTAVVQVQAELKPEAGTSEAAR